MNKCEKNKNHFYFYLICCSLTSRIGVNIIFSSQTLKFEVLISIKNITNLTRSKKHKAISNMSVQISFSPLYYKHQEAAFIAVLQKS